MDSWPGMTTRFGSRPESTQSYRPCGNCATTLIDHANRYAEQPIPFSVEVLFPALAGRLLERLDLLKSGGDDPEAFRIDGRIRALADGPGFSRRLRATGTRESADPAAAGS